MPRPKTWGPTIGLRLRLADDAALRQQAEERGIKPSVLIRQIVLEKIDSSAQGEKKVLKGDE